MGFKIALEIAKWIALAWVALGAASGFYMFFRALWREWKAERGYTIRNIKLPKFVIDPTRTKEQERAHFIVILRALNPRMSYADYVGALRHFEDAYDEIMAQAFRDDLERMAPEDWT